MDQAPRQTTLNAPLPELFPRPIALNGIQGFDRAAGRIARCLRAAARRERHEHGRSLCPH